MAGTQQRLLLFYAGSPVVASSSGLSSRARKSRLRLVRLGRRRSRGEVQRCG